MAAQSTGMFPKYATWVDAATILPTNGDALAVPPLNHSAEVHFVAYFNSAAAGEIVINLNNGYSVTMPAQAGKKVIAVRSGYEMGEGVTEATLDLAGLSAGAVQVSVF